MGLNDTPNGERIRIGIFGNRNAGKSSLINAITGQTIAVVSDVAGTTTDPVSKAMELLPIGPVLITDTPGYDDCGKLGRMRVAAAYRVMEHTDIALLVIDAASIINDARQPGDVRQLSAADKQILSQLKEWEVPYIIVYNKIDLCDGSALKDVMSTDADKEFDNKICVSAKTGFCINELRNKK